MASAEILRLQNQLKRAPEAFIEDFLRQQQHFNSTLEIFKAEGKQNTTRTKEFAALMSFMCQAAPCYKDKCTNLPDQLLNLLETNYEILDPFLRKTLVQGLLLLQNRKLIDRLKVLPVFFTLFRAQDKHLRTMIFNHIVNDIKNVNRKKPNPKLNATLQNFVTKMLKDENPVAAQKSLGVMVELWRRQVWTNDKTVNAIASACFSKNPKLMAAALRFFLGVAPVDDDLEEGTDEKAKLIAKEVKMQQVIVASGSIVHVRRKKKRERELKRAIKTIKQIKTVECAETKISASAIQLLYDPQQFVERLFSNIKQGTLSADHRMLIMNVLSRVIGFHKLILLNFYPFLQRYMQPHQKNVTQILTFLAQASHELVDPDVLGPCIGTLANHFVNDRSSPAVMAVGLNSIREVCARCPLAMTQDLLVDLAQYKKSKEKGVMMASRSLIALFRNLNPALLRKQDRDKASALMMQAGELFQGEMEYGALRPATDVAGASLLEAEGFAEGEEAWKVEPPKAADSDDEDDDEDEEEPWIDEEEEPEGKAPASKKRKVGSKGSGEGEGQSASQETAEQDEGEEDNEDEEGEEGDAEGEDEGDEGMWEVVDEGDEGDEEDDEQPQQLPSTEPDEAPALIPVTQHSNVAETTADKADSAAAKNPTPVVSCGTCSKPVSITAIPTSMAEGWNCDSPLHKGERKMPPSSTYYGCETTEACDWSICHQCFLLAQQSSRAPAPATKLPISATRILTPKDFERIKQLREQHDQELRTRGKKRHKEDGATLGEAKASGTIVDEKDLVGWVKKVRKTKAERLASITEGREGRDKFGRPKQKGGGTTNEAKLRNKPFALQKHNAKNRKKKGQSAKNKSSTLTTHIKNLKSRAKNKRKRTSH